MIKLSEKELEVLPLLTKGMTNQQIADQLFVTEETIKAHVTSIMKKLGVKNRTEASYFSMKNKLVDE